MWDVLIQTSALTCSLTSGVSMVGRRLMVRGLAIGVRKDSDSTLRHRGFTLEVSVVSLLPLPYPLPGARNSPQTGAGPHR
jgi:hypothetical protein